jgi:hypothetical protein
MDEKRSSLLRVDKAIFEAYNQIVPISPTALASEYLPRRHPIAASGRIRRPSLNSKNRTVPEEATAMHENLTAFFFAQYLEDRKHQHETERHVRPENRFAVALRLFRKQAQKDCQ